MTSRVRSHTARRAEALAAVVALALVAGCGGEGGSAVVSEEDPPAPEKGDQVIDISGTQPVGEMTAGSVASLVECRDWNGASPEEQLATIADVRSQINLEDSGIDAPALTDGEALEFFDGACEPAYAQGFRLYKLYARAAAFITLKRELDE